MIGIRTNFFFITAITLLITTSISAQNPSGQISDWKNNAQGAYSIIHDDYGDTGVDGIWQYADTICSNRNINFTFGAITSKCEVTRTINGYSSPYAYAKEVMMAQHGHEIMNHSHTHSCAVGNETWDPCDSPSSESWGENAGSVEFLEELETSHQSIHTNTGHTSVYYIFPYDRFTEAANDYLKSLGYIGSRTGWISQLAGSGWYHRNGYENSDDANFYPDADGFFRTAVEVFDDVDRAKNVSGQVSELNGEVDNAIASNMWANRELHNVGTSGWGSVKVDAYRQHIDYIKAKKESGELWVATISDILTYQMQKLKYVPLVSYSASNSTVNVQWQSTNPQYNVVISEYLNPLDIKCPITLQIDLDGLDGEWSVVQNGIVISDVNQVADQLYINVFPHEGNLVITKSGDLGNQAPYVSNSIPNYANLLSNFEAFDIDLNNAFEDFETDDANLLYSYSGNTNLNISINNGIATISSPQNWTGSESITFTTEDEEGVTVDEVVIITATDIFVGHTPYSGTPISIPGRVEVEDYDEGNEGVVFNEVATNWEPDPWDNPYRNGSDVDIVSNNGGGYSLSFTETGEWLDYTIDVVESGYYDVSFSIAQLEDQWGSPVGQIKLYIDNEEWIPTTTMQYTSSWTDFQTVAFPGQVYLEEGGHLLRMEFTTGSVNVDYIDIESDLITSNEFKNNQEQPFFVYPNPSATSIKVYGDFEEIVVLNQFGIEVLRSDNAEVDVSALHSGVYFIKKDNGVEVVKFVKN